MATKAKGKSKSKAEGKSKKKASPATTSSSAKTPKESIIIPKQTLQKIIPLKSDLHIEDLDEDVLKERFIYIIIIYTTK